MTTAFWVAFAHAPSVLVADLTVRVYLAFIAILGEIFVVGAYFYC